ncbi:hypothetical protein SDJN03_22199, partial [Cucurbita argyrosperma subsp. sororia]
MKLSPFLFSFLLALSVSASTFSPDTPLESADGGFDSLALEPSGEFPLSGRGVFNVNDYGAVADGKTENSLAFMAAWEEACAFKGDSIFLIPEGTFLVAGVTFSGPCFNNLSPKVLIFATLIAPTKLTTDVWIHFHSLRHLLLTGLDGSAVLNGQGAQTWSFGSACRRRMTCPIFTTSSSVKLSEMNMRNISGTYNTKLAVNIDCSSTMPCNNIHLSYINLTATHPPEKYELGRFNCMGALNTFTVLNSTF